MIYWTNRRLRKHRPAIRATLASHGKPPRPAEALTSAEVKRLLARCGGDMARLRDKSLLLVGFTGALQCSALVGSNREYRRFTSEGRTVLIPRANGDQEGDG